MSSGYFGPIRATGANPGEGASAAAAAAAAEPPHAAPVPKKRKNHRGGKKKRQRRKSFAVPDDGTHNEQEEESGAGFYRMPKANLSGTSIDSETLLDHREHQPMRIRRPSTIPAPSTTSYQGVPSPAANRLRPPHIVEEEAVATPGDETAPLLSGSMGWASSGYGGSDRRGSRPRTRSHGASSVSSNNTRRRTFPGRRDVNHPPSMPGSPTYGPSDGIDVAFGDVMIRDELDLRSSSPARSTAGGDALDCSDETKRRAAGAEEDVCFPGPGMSEMGDDEMPGGRDRGAHRFRTRSRRGQWPDLSPLEEWNRLEKEDRSEERRVKNITEPQLINGRLRPVRKGWFQTDEDAPYRFTYFNEEFQSTIHSQTISELVQPGGDFQELFIPAPRVLSDDEDEEEDDDAGTTSESRRGETNSSSKDVPPLGGSRDTSGRGTPSQAKSSGDSTRKPTPSPAGAGKEKQPRYGERPVWWLDVLCPTEAEMRVISKTFGIHPLTTEDIMLQEAREKVELFRHYYFVNYRTFDQDVNSENFLEPVDMYVVVFREGVLSFHFSMTPHPANVRRRIRQLRDYLILSSDWISYAIIDDITDVFQPLIQNIEDEVDEIDEAILQLHSSAEKRMKDDNKIVTVKGDEAATMAESTGDMLRRVGDCRKRVMSLYRLLGNKADVIKGFAKRCNERWEVAPRSEIGLYLGDIQDHIVTMTSNLGHYEKILARSHGNYLAQINIRMNERQEQTADVLGKLTVLGTIVLPMNIITGLWGMNVWVPGQEYEGDLTWFFWITAGLIGFGVACYLIAKRVYQIV